MGTKNSVPKHVGGPTRQFLTIKEGEGSRRREGFSSEHVQI